MVEHTRVPNTPGYVQGVINLRGKVIPIVNSEKEAKDYLLKKIQEKKFS